MSERGVCFDAAVLRREYAAAGAALLDLAGTVPDDAWTAPGLGTWSIRDLVGHSGRSFVTVTEYLAAGVGRTPELDHALDYARVFTMLHGDPGPVDERARQAGRAIGPDPLAGLRAQYDEAVAAVAAHADDAPVATLAGVMRLADYLPCRIFELVVHTDDLARALGGPAVGTAPGSTAARTIATVFAAAVAAENHDDAVVLLRALTGRALLPSGFTAL